MGKKINPKILRITTTNSHLSKWFAPKNKFAHYLQQDVEIRKLIRQKLRDGGVSRVEIRRSSDKITIHIYTSKPAVVIGRSGSGIEELRKTVKRKFFGSEKMKINMEVLEVRNPETDAELVMQSVAFQLEKRVPFRRAMKRAIESVIGAGAKGVKIICAGRLNGVEIARTETLVQGSIPTHTLRADLDYARGAAYTLYGKIGVKVWIYKGLIFGAEKDQVENQPQERPHRRPRPAQKPAPASAQSPAQDQKKRRTIIKGGHKKTTVVPKVVKQPEAITE